MGKTITIKTYDPAKDGFGSKFIGAENLLKQKGIKVKLKRISGTATAADIKKYGKKAEFVIELERHTLHVRLEYASKKIKLAAIDLDAESDVKKRRAVMEELHKLKLVDKAALADFERDNPDPDRIRDLELEWKDADRHVDSLVGDIKALKDFRYDKFTNGGNDTSALLYQASKRKLDQYFHFVRDVDIPRDGRKIYEKYLADGAKAKVILARSIRSKLEEAYEANKPLEYKVARAYVVRAIDKKIVPKFAPSLLSAYKKELAIQKKRRDHAAKELKGFGVKASY